jgi:hypothetical protein
VPLRIDKKRIILPVFIDCPKLRIRMQYAEFVIDTGSPESYLNQHESQRLQIPIRDRPIMGSVAFGGSRFSHVELPEMTFHMYTENGPVSANAKLQTLITSEKPSKEKIEGSQLPNIIGISFLELQNLGLHVIIHEDNAYLET